VYVESDSRDLRDCSLSVIDRRPSDESYHHEIPAARGHADLTATQDSVKRDIKC
jgi:hypothetical protein